MSARYTLVVADCAGPYHEESYQTLGGARLAEAIARERWPTKSVTIHDNERDGRAVDPDEDDDHG